MLLFGAGALSGVPVKRYFEPVVQLELQFAMARQFLACSHCISMAMHLKIVISPFEHAKARQGKVRYSRLTAIADWQLAAAIATPPAARLPPPPPPITTTTITTQMLLNGKVN